MKGRLMKKSAVLLVAVLLVAGALLVSSLLVVAKPNPKPSDFVTLQGTTDNTVFSCTETSGVGECGFGACVADALIADCASQLTGSGFKLKFTTFPCAPGGFCGAHFVFTRKG